jgi:oligopeptide transport system ATP-binding protein
MTESPLLEIHNAHKTFHPGGFISRHGPVQAVRGVTLDVQPGETVAVVGESGCGKTTLGRLAVGLDQPTGGDINFQGNPIPTRKARNSREFRRGVQMIFQDTFGSLNPFHEVARLVSEPWRAFPDMVSKRDRNQRVLELLEMVGLGPEHMARLPAQLSGGQRQRVGIARALALNPKIIVCDEPVSALDVSVQAQIINLLQRLQRDLGISYLFISHDLRLVSYLADRVAVMYLGKIVEEGPVAQVFGAPTHPYTQALLSNSPEPFPWRHETVRLPMTGEVPSPANPPSGCGFRTRCWKAEQHCADVEPELLDRLDIGHPSACHFASLRQDAVGTGS